MMMAVVVRLVADRSVRIAVIPSRLWLINSYAILCNGCANSDNHSLNYSLAAQLAAGRHEYEHNAQSGIKLAY
jgi:hypothetical protein